MIKIQNLKQLNKGSIIARFDVEFPSIGLIIRDCSLLEGKSGRFVSWPSRQYEADGVKKYFSYIFWQGEKQKEVNEKILSLLSQEMPSEDNDDVPF